MKKLSCFGLGFGLGCIFAAGLLYFLNYPAGLIGIIGVMIVAGFFIHETLKEGEIDFEKMRKGKY